MSLSRETLAQELADPEYRYAYAEDFLNAYVATQIVALREQRGLSQEALGRLIGTKQPGVSRLENVNHSTWKTDTLKKIARALGVRLKISFETFGTLLEEDETFCRRSLMRWDFDEDPSFKNPGPRPELQEPAFAADPRLGDMGVSLGATLILGTTNLLAGPIRDRASEFRGAFEGSAFDAYRAHSRSAACSNLFAQPQAPQIDFRSLIGPGVYQQRMADIAKQLSPEIQGNKSVTYKDDPYRGLRIMPQSEKPSQQFEVKRGAKYG